jgi:nitrite reductase/ring-hydroxylating ferredoxin subunit
MKLTTIIVSTTLLFTACNAKSNNSHKIASIPEASGISYCHNSNTLMVANDEGSFYEITPNGAIISEHKLGKYDLEGVVCEDKKIIFAVEDGALLEVDRKTLKTKFLKIKGQNFKFSKKSGIEGITKIKNLYYVSIQAKKEKDSIILVLKVGNNHAKVIKTIEHGIIDSAGMQYHDKKLYIVSDKKDKLYVYNLKKEKIKRKIKLPKFAQEGIAFGRNKDIYFALS